jgi:hypothetical protein
MRKIDHYTASRTGQSVSNLEARVLRELITNLNVTSLTPHSGIYSVGRVVFGASVQNFTPPD